MKRSEINQAILKAQERLAEFKITLPMFAYWKMEDWKNNKSEIGRINNSIYTFISCRFHQTIHTTDYTDIHV